MPSPKMPIRTFAEAVAFVRAEADKANARSGFAELDWQDQRVACRFLRAAADALEAAIAATPPAEPVPKLVDLDKIDWLRAASMVGQWECALYHRDARDFNLAALQMLADTMKRAVEEYCHETD